MTAALLSIGSELLQGDIANTNGQWLAEQLTEVGFVVAAIECVPDERAAIVEALQRLRPRHSVTVCTGGLGPTSDDLTADAAAVLVGRPLCTNEEALAAIARRLEARGELLKPCHEKQARIPEGSEVLSNSKGTAAGFLIKDEQSAVYFLPGVPREMKAMFTAHVLPRVRIRASNNRYQIVLHTYGAPESWLAEQLDGVERGHDKVTFAYRAKGIDTDVKIIGRGADPAEARQHAEAAAAEARAILGEKLYGEGDDTIVHIAGRSVRSRGWRLAVAESCTGGLIAQQLTSMPASDYFVGGAVTYANSAKTGLLGVSEDTLRGHGAVSAEVAAEMAEGARRAFDCDVAISVTGIAGPSGATGDKPRGLCHWAVAFPGGTVVEHQVFKGSRVEVQRQAAHAVLDLLRRTCASA